MPFVSKSQRRFMWAKHPEIAKRWAEEAGSTPKKQDAISRAMRQKRQQSGAEGQSHTTKG